MSYLAFARLNGRFGTVEGTLTIDEVDPARSSVTALIDVTTIDTGIRLRDAHLRSSEFFDASRYPQMTFRSTFVENVSDSSWRVVGDLTVRDITKEVVLQTVYEGQTPHPDGSRRAAFSASTILSRRAYGLGRRGGGVIVSDRVDVSLQITAVSAELFLTRDAALSNS